MLRIAGAITQAVSATQASKVSITIVIVLQSWDTLLWISSRFICTTLSSLVGLVMALGLGMYDIIYCTLYGILCQVDYLVII